MIFALIDTKFHQARWKQKRPFTFWYCVDNFYPWEDIVGKKVSKLRSIAELRALYGNPLVNRKQSYDAITNKKQEKFDQLNANNVIKQSGVHILCKKFKNIIILRRIIWKF